MLGGGIAAYKSLDLIRRLQDRGLRVRCILTAAAQHFVTPLSVGALAGERQQLTIRSERLTSRRLQTGSRLIMVLGVNKRPDREINYGSGADVSEESAADGAIPVKLRWYSSSYIEIPIRK